jgi:hypothetical protein
MPPKCPYALEKVLEAVNDLNAGVVGIGARDDFAVSTGKLPYYISSVDI